MSPRTAEFKPMLVAVCRDRKKRTVERVMVAPTPEARVEAAEELGRTVARDGLKPFAVTQATEAWMGADDGRRYALRARGPARGARDRDGSGRRALPHDDPGGRAERGG